MKRLVWKSVTSRDWMMSKTHPCIISTASLTSQRYRHNAGSMLGQRLLLNQHVCLCLTVEQHPLNIELCPVFGINIIHIVGPRLYQRYAFITDVSRFNHVPAKLSGWHFHPFEVVSRWRNSQLQVGENYTYLFNLRLKIADRDG